MAVHGINGGSGQRPLGGGALRPEGARARLPVTGGRAEPKVAARAADAGVLSLEAPPGTDPALWSMLTTEERVFFARAQSLGPLTYRPGVSLGGGGGIGRGHRIDVKV